MIQINLQAFILNYEIFSDSKFWDHSSVNYENINQTIILLDLQAIWQLLLNFLAKQTFNLL